MLHRTLLAASVTLASMLAGCATTKPEPTVEPKKDPVGDIISKYAESATKSLRALSESEGGSRTVQLEPTVSAPAAPTPVVVTPGTIPTYTAPVTREGAVQQQIIVVPQYVPMPVAAPTAPAPASAGSQTGTVAKATGAAASSVVPMVRSAERIVYGAGGVTGGGDVLTTIPSGLEKRITLADVTDDVEGILERISRQVGYIRLPSIGVRVSQQPLTVNAIDRPAIEVIRDLSGAVGRNAEIVVTPGNRTLAVQFPVR